MKNNKFLKINLLFILYKTMDKCFLLFTILLLFNSCYNVEVGDTIKLPEPQRVGGPSLYEAFNHRKSSRDFVESELSLELLSQALWCCYGYAEDGHRTVPSAKAWYPLLIYVFTKDGVFLYNPEDHELTKLFDGDYRSLTGTQTEVVTKAAVNFVFIGDLNKYSAKLQDKKIKREAVKYDMGDVSEALYLFASANNMKGVVRGNFHESRILKFLGLSSEDYYLILAYSLGY